MRPASGGGLGCAAFQRRHAGRVLGQPHLAAWHEAHVMAQPRRQPAPQVERGARQRDLGMWRLRLRTPPALADEAWRPQCGLDHLNRKAMSPGLERRGKADQAAADDRHIHAHAAPSGRLSGAR